MVGSEADQRATESSNRMFKSKLFQYDSCINMLGFQKCNLGVETKGKGAPEFLRPTNAIEVELRDPVKPYCADFHLLIVYVNNIVVGNWQKWDQVQTTPQVGDVS
jgi:hypothetical protein